MFLVSLAGLCAFVRATPTNTTSKYLRSRGLLTRRNILLFLFHHQSCPKINILLPCPKYPSSHSQTQSNLIHDSGADWKVNSVKQLQSERRNVTWKEFHSEQQWNDAHTDRFINSSRYCVFMTTLPTSFCCDLMAINGPKMQQAYVMMRICLQDDKQITPKMLVLWKEFWWDWLR